MIWKGRLEARDIPIRLIPIRSKASRMAVGGNRRASCADPRFGPPQITLSHGRICGLQVDQPLIALATLSLKATLEGYFHPP